MQSVLLSDIFNTSEYSKMSVAYVYAEKHLVQVLLRPSSASFSFIFVFLN